MKKEIKDLLETSDSQDSLKRAEELVARGVLARFEVKGVNQFYYDPSEVKSSKGAVLAVASLNGFKGREKHAIYDSDFEEAKIWQEAQERLHKLFPKLAHFEELYEQRMEKSKKRWG